MIAFESNSAQDEDYVNSQEWRKAEIPSANGHGTAKSLAKLYGILSTGCSRDSFTIMPLLISSSDILFLSLSTGSLS